MLRLFTRIFGTANDRIIKKLLSETLQINLFEKDLEALSNQELANHTAQFREDLKNGKSLDDISHEAFAVVREAGKRVLGMRHFDVQLIGGLILHKG